MKSIIYISAIILFSISACTDPKNHTNTEKISTSEDLKVVQEKIKEESKTIFPIKETLSGYLQLKNALTNDNGKDAATAGDFIVAVLAKIDTNGLNKDQMKAYMGIADDLKENAEHIGANAGKIDHQREHFELLSKDITDLIKTFGNGGQTLYKDFCPMANDGKGAMWISEMKEIKNPYLGKSMPTCGIMKEEMK